MSPFLYGLTSSPDHNVCLSLGSQIIREMGNIPYSVERVEYCIGGSYLKGWIGQSSW